MLPPFELELIIAHILKKSREYVLAHPEIKLNKAQLLRLEKIKRRRERHEPMAYILGKKEFYGLDFKVTKATLVPRPETELMVEEIIKRIPTNKKLAKTAILDLGTGTGNIIIAVAKSINTDINRKLIATDFSPQALGVAKYNARKHKLDKKIKFFTSDILKNNKLINYLKENEINHLIIAANLPYLSRKIYNATPSSVKNFEPQTALISGKDGLNHYRQLFKEIRELKKEITNLSFSLFLEISPEQKEKLASIIRKTFPKAKIYFQKDLARKWRLVFFEI